MKKTILVLCLIIINLFVICSCTKNLTAKEQYELLISNDTPVDTLQVTYCYENDKLENVVGYSDYVFVGIVKNYIGTINDTPSEIPQTIYSVEIIKNIKGNLFGSDINLIKCGGLAEDYKSKIIYEDDIIPEINQCYIFFVFASNNGEICAGGLNSNIKIENAEKYFEDANYIRTIDAYENQVVYDRTRYKSKYDQE